MRLCYNPFHEKDGRFAWADLNAWVDEASKSGREQLKQFISFCMEAARDCMVINCEAGQLARFDDTVIPNFSKFSRFIHEGNIVEITSLLNKAHYQVERNANPRILLLDLSFKIHRLLNLKRQT
jgi:DNA polymerase-3 subunit delta'